MNCEINFDNPKHKRFINDLKEQGALEELKRIYELGYHAPREYVDKYINKRIKELEEGEKK